MIKFFSKIRRSLLSENKFNKYLLYAIGEIVLVVIGILIALSINSAYSERLNRKESRAFNHRLLAEVNENVQLSDSIIQRIETKLNSTKGILDLTSTTDHEVNSNSLDSLMNFSIWGIRVTFRTGTLNEGLNTGKVALIDSEVLKSQLYGLESEIGFVLDYDGQVQRYNLDFLQPFLYDKFNYRKMDNVYSGFNIGPTKFMNDHNKALLENEQFENLIDNHYFQGNLQLQYHQDLLKIFEKIKRLIQAELEA